MATDLQALETELVLLIAPTCAAHLVSVGKLNAYELNQPVQSGQAFINYAGVQISEPLTFNAQRIATYRFDFLVRYTNLTSHDQAYPLLAAIKDRFRDYEPRDYEPMGDFCTKPMRLIREIPPTIQQQLDGFWLYVQEYEFDLLEV